MTEEQWNTSFTRCFGMRLGGDAMLEWDERGERVHDDTFLLLFNADASTIPFSLPRSTPAVRWTVVLSTDEPDVQEGSWTAKGGERIPLVGRSILILKRLEGK